MSLVTLQYNCSNDIPVWLTLQIIITAGDGRVITDMVNALVKDTHFGVFARRIILGEDAMVSII